MTSPAEFRCTREFLGLEVGWLADHLGVSRRQLSRWEAGTSPIPAEAVDAVEDLADYTRGCVMRIAHNWPLNKPLATYRDDVTEVGPVKLPASWHRSVCMRAALAVLRPAGIEFQSKVTARDLRYLAP